jgi:hypothetical protein
MPAAIFFVRLDLEKNSSFLDRHYLVPDKKKPGSSKTSVPASKGDTLRSVFCVSILPGLSLRLI